MNGNTHEDMTSLKKLPGCYLGVGDARRMCLARGTGQQAFAACEG